MDPEKKKELLSEILGLSPEDEVLAEAEHVLNVQVINDFIDKMVAAGEKDGVTEVETLRSGLLFYMGLVKHMVPLLPADAAAVLLLSAAVLRPDKPDTD